MEMVGTHIRQVADPHKGSIPIEKAWLDKELSGSKFRDARLDKRFRTLIQHLSDGLGGSIPLVCQDWANTNLITNYAQLKFKGIVERNKI